MTERKTRARHKDLPGKTFGRLRVLGAEGQDLEKRWYWRCKCICGAVTFVRTDDLVAGKAKSCGCLRKNLFPAREQ